MPGSLIFVVIVAVWAAYLVQHWVHRREDAAATRSVDSFSEAMRVLQKRPLFPATALRTPRPDSYAVLPGRSARPTVDVKRALPVGASRPLSPLVARRLGLGSAAGSQPVLSTAPVAPRDAIDATEVTDLPDATDGPDREEPMSPQPNRTHRPASHQGRPVAAWHGPSLTRRRLRAALLVASLLWVPTSIVLAVVGVLLWMSVPFAFLTVVAVLVYLRTEVAADRARAAGHSGTDLLHTDEFEELADFAELAELDESSAVSGERALTSDDTQVIVAARHGSSAPSRPRPAVVVFDVQAPVSRTPRRDAAAAAAAEHAPVAEAATPAEGTWVPVPVPTPTYAMKAKAPTRLTESGIPADVFDTPEFADEADELDDRALFARRAVSQ